MALPRWMALLTLLGTPALAQDPEFGQVEVQVMNEVVIVACAKGKTPCFPGRADLGCVPEGLEPKAFDKACQNFREALAEFDYDCFIKSGTKTLYAGKTRTVEVCRAMQAVWDEVAKDPFLKEKSEEWRLRFLRQTLLKPRGRGRKDNPGVADQLQFKKSGKIRKSSNETERLLEKAHANLKDYRADLECGVGIVPGIDQVPLLNQKSQGTCYAHTSATLIDYIRKARGGAEYPVFGSPLMGAIDYHLNSKDAVDSCSDPLGGGFVCNAFNTTLQRGFCGSDKIEQAIHKSFKAGSGSKKESWYLEWAKKQNLSVSTDAFKLKPYDAVNEYLYVIGTLFKEKHWTRLQELHEALKKNGPKGEECRTQSGRLDLNWELVKLSPNLEAFYASYFETLCDREPFPFQASCTSHWSGLTPEKIDGILSKGYPVGIYYCSAILKDHRYRSPHQPVWKDEKKCGPHASMIVGTSRDSKGQCTYVVRNSWGKDCGVYDKAFECKDGHIYIPKDTLVKQLYGLQEISVK